MDEAIKLINNFLIEIAERQDDKEKIIETFLR